MLVEGHGHADEHGEAAYEHKAGLHGGQAHAAEEEVAHADDAVDAGLGEHAGDEHGDRARGRAVGVRGYRVEGEHEALAAEAGEEQREGEHHRRVHPPRQQRRDLSEVQRVALGVHQRGAEQHAGGADGADNEVLEGRLARVGVPAAEGREAHGGEGHDFQHDVDVEEVAREDDAHDAAREHEIEREVAPARVVLLHVPVRVEAGAGHGDGDEQAEEQAQRVHLYGDADCVAVHRLPVAHPVDDYLPVHHDGLYEQRQQRQRYEHGGAGDDVAELFPLAREGHEERADEERHYGQHGEVHIDVVCHPCSLLISRASSVPYSL